MLTSHTVTVNVMITLDVLVDGGQYASYTWTKEEAEAIYAELDQVLRCQIPPPKPPAWRYQHGELVEERRENIETEQAPRWSK